ncbi:RNA-binding ATPase activator ESF2 [Aspergillus thermomutatus]|uniref:Pre-rRNA-processing protein ESF2 n=1 Tax=Aspergillus thermomutatus TaxID=41047 RepID=A0A397HJ08_ASPTH|nr:RNA-binding ATPase activator esf2 [Aspergillus thermomutatus]RHZ63072.1 RNA-binding ATPase activator esf2 [Aspergillus thermomutatus]
MTTRKRNEFLDIVSDDDEGSDRGYDSEAAEESKGRFAKRRKTHTRADDLSDEESDIGSSESEDDSKTKLKGKPKSKSQTTKHSNDSDDEDEDEDADADDDGEKMPVDQYLDTTVTQSPSQSPSTSSATAKSTKLKKKPLDKTRPPKKNKTGVIYLSSLPPYLKPFALKSMLETRGFAPITKVFLTPEVPSTSAPRRRSNKRKSYADGWVEFASKKTAKICAETLNATIVGGKKGGWYHDDVWNMKYLKGFKWADLMEQVQRERSEREAKRRIEDTRARKEDKVFLQGVEQGKVLQGIQKKNEEKRKKKAEIEGEAAADAAASDLKIRRLFKQNEVKMGRDKIKDNSTLEDDAKRVLSKIF